MNLLVIAQNKKKLIRTSQTKFYRNISRSLTYGTRNRMDTHDLIMRHINTHTYTHIYRQTDRQTYVRTLQHLTTRVTVSLQPFRLRSGSAALATIPARSESRFMRFVLYVAVNPGSSLTIFSARYWKYFPSTHIHASHLTNTLFNKHGHYTSTS